MVLKSWAKMFLELLSDYLLDYLSDPDYYWSCKTSQFVSLKMWAKVFLELLSDSTGMSEYYLVNMFAEGSP